MGGPFFLCKILPFMWSTSVLAGMSKFLATPLIFVPLSTAAMATCIYASVYCPTLRFGVLVSDLQVERPCFGGPKSVALCALLRGGLSCCKCTCRLPFLSNCSELHAFAPEWSPLQPYVLQNAPPVRCTDRC